ncbi:uncharacterized protein LOC132312423 [Cornus florida]|uniref:uncharacterized protein LOC132312423 n=1 Tax=Cornus florida TaxID=4283 RepID=UPI0028996F2D|nr:uncharacterized protein LOC132312423 [Cornus florida]
MDSSGSNKAQPHCDKSYDDDEEENQKSRDPNSDSEGEEEGYSDDGYNDGLHNMTRKECFEYYTRVQESDGFDVPEFPNVFALGIIVPYLVPGEPFEDESSLEELNTCSLLAIQDFNGRNDENYEFVKVVKANMQPVSGAMFFITFEAKNKDVGPVETFEAKVYAGITEMEALMCRRKTVATIDQGTKG